MPRTVTDVTSVDGYLRSVSLSRTGDGKISIAVVILEIVTKNGATVSSRERTFTQDDLTQLQRDNLLALYDNMESRIRTNFYT